MMPLWSMYLHGIDALLSLPILNSKINTRSTSHRCTWSEKGAKRLVRVADCLASVEKDLEKGRFKEAIFKTLATLTNDAIVQGSYRFYLLIIPIVLFSLILMYPKYTDGLQVARDLYCLLGNWKPSGDSILKRSMPNGWRNSWTIDPISMPEDLASHSIQRTVVICVSMHSRMYTPCRHSLWTESVV